MRTIERQHDHAVQFYENDAFLCDTVAAFVAEGLSAAQPIIIIATAEHVSGITQQLVGHGHDYDRVAARGQLMHLDANATLQLFMRNDMPDADLFASSVGRIVGERLQAHRNTSVRAYGEMVDVLWRAGNAAGALRLEELWNELAEQYSFSLLCAYSIANFYKISDAEYFDRICDKHTHVIPAESVTGIYADGQAREISMLQQRAVALEAELVKAHRAKADFLGVMSHELRTPLNAILGYDDLLAQEVGGPTTEAQRTYIGRIRNSAEQLMHLIDQVLSLSRIETGSERLDLESTNVAALVRDAVERVEPIAAARGLLFESVFLSEHIDCYTDATKVREIILNLLSNALKFTPSGRIRVTVGKDAADTAVITVEDTGVGIEDVDVARIFERFVQVDATASRRFGGTGVGLSISRDFARILGGEITVRSEPGHGSEFTLRLPQRASNYTQQVVLAVMK